MNKIYLVSHPAERFDDDFRYLRPIAEYCAACGGRVDSIPTPLQYRWDKEFQSEEAKNLTDQQEFWGSLLLFVPRSVRSALEKLSAFEFYETCLVQTEFVGNQLIVHEIEDASDPLYWAKPKSKVVARVSGTPNKICDDCGFFTGPRQLTRLRVDHNEVPNSGIFSVAQNSDPQIFVTEEGKERLCSLDIAAGYYSAGRIE